jgi:RecA/RadA recombinase
MDASGIEAPRFFVGRKRHLNVILGGELGEGALFDVPGVEGSGKTALLRQLYYEVVKVQRHRATLISMSDYLDASEMVTSGAGAVEPAEEYGLFCRVMDGILEGLPPHKQVTDVINQVAGQLKELAAASQGPAGVQGGYLQAGVGAEPPLAASVIESRARKFIKDAQKAAAGLARDLAAGQVGEGQRIFVLVDEFEAVQHRPMGRWFLDLLSGLTGMVVVIAHQDARRGRLSRLSLPDSVVTDWLPLGGLEVEDVKNYLIQRPGVGPEVHGIVAPVIAFTEGHAQAVGLVADLIRDNGGAEASGLLVRQLAAKEEGPARHLGELVDRIVSVVKDDTELASGLDALWVVRRLTPPLLASLLDLESDRVVELVSRLAEYSFVEERGSTNGGEPYFTIHQFIREHGERKLRLHNLTRHQELCRRAEAYYQEQISSFPEGYDAWFNYEDKRWQSNEQEWLYYVAHLDGADRLHARLGVARLFFDTFWWWGNYIDFRFCTDILEDWAEMADLRQDEDDQAWGESLRCIYDLYPKGWRRKEAADWRGIRENLLYLRRHGKLAKDEFLTPVGRHVRGLLDVYLADADRYLNPEDNQVAELLQDAREQFEASGNDDWDIAWLSFQAAEDALGRGAGDDAVVLVDGIVQDAVEIDDRELLANLHRVHADAAWLRGEPDLALDCHARSVLHAYHFQIKQDLDKYTAAFMTEMHERTVDRLAELFADGQVETVQTACVRIRSLFGRYWWFTNAPEAPDFAELLEQGRLTDVVRYLFPPAPADTDLNKRRTAYEGAADDFFDRAARILAAKPGTPLPLV